MRDIAPGFERYRYRMFGYNIYLDNIYFIYFGNFHYSQMQYLMQIKLILKMSYKKKPSLSTKRILSFPEKIRLKNPTAST